MGRKAATCLAGALLMTVGVPRMTEAQVATWQEVQVADLEEMGSKFLQLAEAFGESQYDWRPMEGVRSIREVLGRAIAEAHLFPTGWGYEAAPGAARGFGPELERAGALSKAAMVVELETFFDFLSGVVSTMSEEKRLSDGSYFGRAMPVHASVATAMADMHEHLGQLIAYARANHVVPPWSTGND